MSYRLTRSRDTLYVKFKHPRDIYLFIKDFTIDLDTEDSMKAFAGVLWGFGSLRKIFISVNGEELVFDIDDIGLAKLQRYLKKVLNHA
mgnify:CR=1 FL=1